jgi:hypothetical protein
MSFAGCATPSSNGWASQRDRLAVRNALYALLDSCEMR